MALPSFYQRSAVAISQALRGYDEAAIRHRLDGVTIGLQFGRDVATSPEGQAALDLLTRLLARLYGSIQIFEAHGDTAGQSVMDLARSINPDVEMSEGGNSTISVALGEDAPPTSSPVIYAGCDGWRGAVGMMKPLPIGRTANPFGGGIAAALAAANVFRFIFAPDSSLDTMTELSALPVAETLFDPTKVELAADTVLCGAGAIGQAAVWCFQRCEVRGSMHVVDEETIAPDNLQRYVITQHSSPGAFKVDEARRFLAETLEVRPHRLAWASFVAEHGYAWDKILVAVDSARARREVQASLPRWIGNAWTQPGDLGVSRHMFGSGACLSCLYMPKSTGENEDTIISTALGLPEPSNMMRVRELLYRGAGAPRDLLELIAARQPKIELAKLLEYEGRSLRDLYREGFCGGAVLPLGEAGTPRSDVHVPLAHQSAMAGVLLAASLLAETSYGTLERSDALQLNIMRPIPNRLSFQPIQPDGTRCICQDADYRRTYVRKWRRSRDVSAKTAAA
jgi:molybdopterin/thiamine biosynthesis adenylyltransferase